MKIIILSEVEHFCKEHNFQTISLKQLREMAVKNDDNGLAKSYMCGQAHIINEMIEFLGEKRRE